MDITVQNMVKIFEGTLRHNLTAYATGQPVESFKVDYFEGEPGVGKTSGVRQAAANIANDESFLADIAKQTGENPDFRARTFIAAQYEAVDIGGAPWVIEKENTIVMERSRPAIFPENGFGMIFCDELSYYLSYSGSHRRIGTRPPERILPLFSDRTVPVFRSVR